MLRKVIDEAASGRIIGPCDAGADVRRWGCNSRPGVRHVADEVAVESVLLSPRFAVLQGLRADGSMKIRAIDDCTRSGINACTQPSVKLFVEGVDCLVEVLRRVFAITGKAPHLVKADIDAAYRRVPIDPADRWAAAVAFTCKGKVVLAQHAAMPFGAVSSVHAWDRVAKLLLRVARVLLKMPLLAYVDDFLGAETAETAGHGKECFARVVRALLGGSAIADAKLEHGPCLVVLGLVVEVSATGVRCKPSPDKVVKWLQRMGEASAEGLM